MSNTFKIFQDHSSKTAFFFCVCCVFCLDIFGIQNQSFGNRTTNIAFAQGSQTSNSTSQSSWQQVARLATSTRSFFRWRKGCETKETTNIAFAQGSQNQNFGFGLKIMTGTSVLGCLPGAHSYWAQKSFKINNFI